ncbi:hypothetical protein D3C78_888320 [compost metagenome]
MGQYTEAGNGAANQGIGDLQAGPYTTGTVKPGIDELKKFDLGEQRAGKNAKRC